MTGQQSIPIEPDEFDAEVAQRLISTKHPTVTVGTARVVDAALSTAGEQRVPTARRITVDVDYTNNPEGLPGRLTVKVACPGLGDIPLYDNEVNVYLKLGDELPVTTAQCFGAVRDTTTSSFGLALEDLRMRDATFLNVLSPCTVDDLKALLDQLALLHARYWQSPRFGTDMSWVLPHTSGPIHDVFTHPAGVPMLVAWEVQSNQWKRELIESVDETHESLLAKVNLAQAHQATQPTTFVHGDCRIGNTFRLPDGRHGLLDWQLAARGHCIHDVSYLIITGLSVRDRRQHEDELLAHYRRRLVEAGVADAPATETLRHEYRLAAAWCFYIGWLTTPLVNYGWEISVSNHIRLATAYRDLGSKAALEQLS